MPSPACASPVSPAAPWCASPANTRPPRTISARFRKPTAAEICRAFSKYVKRVLDWSTIEVDLRQAFREARAPPQGPALVEIPTNLLYHQDDPARAAARRQSTRPTRCARRRTRARSSAPSSCCSRRERPLIAAGDGVFWSDAAAELRELAELTGIPTYCAPRRPGRAPRGSSARRARGLEEAVHRTRRRRARRRLQVLERRALRRAADLERRRPRTSRSIRRRARIGWHVPAEVAIVGDPKLVLRQLIDAARRLGARLLAARRLVVAAARSPRCAPTTIAPSTSASGSRGAQTPVHPDHLARELCRGHRSAMPRSSSTRSR